MKRALLISFVLAASVGVASGQVASPPTGGELPTSGGEPAAVGPAPAPVRAPRSAGAPAAALREAPPRAIAPVHTRYDELLRAWDARRAALRDGDPSRARAIEKGLLDGMRDLGIEALPDLAASESRAIGAALDANAALDAVARADFAVALAPDLPAAHLAAARATLARDGLAGLATAAASVTAAAAGAASDPATVRALAADLLASALFAAAAGAALVVALLFLRHLRRALHDARHLPGLRLATPPQAAFLALCAIAAPLALALGPAAVLAALALAASAYLGHAERAAATACLVAVALLPWAAERAASATAWAGTLAADVEVLERGDDPGPVAVRLDARADTLPPAALVALGRHHKRRGELDLALRLYERAGLDRPDALVNTGNVRFLRGDLDGASAAYLGAADRAGADLPALAAAYYDLSKVHVRRLALAQAQEARKRAVQADPALLERYGSEDDFRANRWLVDVPLARSELASLAADDAPRGAGEALRRALAGPLPAAGWPWLLLAVAAALWPVALAARRHLPSRACERCGRPACARCDGVTAGLCGQCVSVYVHRDAVDRRDRLLKEAEVRRHARARRALARALSVATGGGGHLWRGHAGLGAIVSFALLFLGALAVTGAGLLPVRHPVPWLAAAKVALAAPLGIAVWSLAVRDLFRRTRPR